MVTFTVAVSCEESGEINISIGDNARLHPPETKKSGRIELEYAKALRVVFNGSVKAVWAELVK